MSQVILIVQFSAQRDGSAISGLQLADGLRGFGWAAHVAFGHEGPMIDDYERAGYATTVVEHKNWLRRDSLVRFAKDVLAERRNIRGFTALLSRIRPDLVYVNTAASYAGVLAARTARLPVVWHLRELFADVGGEMRCPAIVKPWVRGQFLELADHLVCNSQAVATNLLGNGSARAQVIPNVAAELYFEPPLDKSAARQHLGLPQHGVVIGVPGTLRPVKGHAFFLAAAREMSRRNPDWHYAITGAGEPAYGAQLEGLVRRFGLEGRVHFLGSLADLKTFMDASDLICIPSRAEPFGRVAIEAFAAGKPTVATAVGGLCEIFEPGENGLLVPYGDVSALVSALEDLAGNPSLASQMAESARQKAISRYREDKFRAEIATLLGDVPKGKAHAEP